jgi:hypothetical protein
MCMGVVWDWMPIERLSNLADSQTHATIDECLQQGNNYTTSTMGTGDRRMELSKNHNLRTAGPIFNFQHMKWSSHRGEYFIRCKLKISPAVLKL